MTDKPALIIINSLGTECLERLGFNERLLRHVRSTGKFASGWYRPILTACNAVGAECPLDAFNWKDTTA